MIASAMKYYFTGIILALHSVGIMSQTCAFNISLEEEMAEYSAKNWPCLIWDEGKEDSNFGVGIDAESITIEATKNEGLFCPQYLFPTKDLRLYGGNILKISSSYGSNISRIVFHLSKHGIANLAMIIPSSGEIVKQSVGDSIVVWEGNAPSVSFKIGYGALGAAPFQGKEIRTLSIGNSYTMNFVNEHIYKLANVLGDSVYNCIASVSGAVIDEHLAYLKSDSPQYYYKTLSNELSSIIKERTLRSILIDQKWDIITNQQVYSSNKEYLPVFLDSIKSIVSKDNPDCLMTWGFTWAHTDHYHNREKTSEEEYADLLNILYEIVFPSGINSVIPIGTAILEGYKLLGESIYTDGSHISKIGEYIAACSFVKYLTGKDILGSMYWPSYFDQRSAMEYQAIADMALLDLPDGVSQVYPHANNNKTPGLLQVGELAFQSLDVTFEPMPLNFSDKLTETLCLQHWDFNNDSIFDIHEAHEVSTIGNVFQATDIISFEELPYFSSITKIPEEAFKDCCQLTKITLPMNISSIEERAFMGCDNLSSIVIPSNVKTIGNNTFTNCDLTTIHCMMEDPIDISSTTFENDAYSDATLTVPYGKASKYGLSSYWGLFNHISERGRLYIDIDTVWTSTSTNNMYIDIKNSKPFVAFTLYVKTPLNMTIDGATISSQISNDFQLFVNEIPNSDEFHHSYRIEGGSPSNTPLQGNITKWLILTTHTSPDATGSFSVILELSEFTCENFSKTYADGDVKTFNKQSYIGDVDFDGSLSTNDIEKMARAILGNKPESILPSYYDLDGDGFINLYDFAKLLKMIYIPEK